MSHAQTVWQADDESLLSRGRMTDWTYTANAMTATSPSELSERFTFAILSAWRIETRQIGIMLQMNAAAIYIDLHQ